MIEIELLGDKELLRKLEGENLLGPPLHHAFEGATELTEGEVKLETPRDTGHLFQSITHEVDSAPIPEWGKVGTNKEYAVAVEEGTKPHKVSPRKLSGWARRHHMNPFAVAGAIAKRGTKPNHMFYFGWKTAEKDVEEYFEEAAREIEEAFGR